MKNLPKILFVFLFLLLCPLTAWSVHFNHIGMKDGLSQISVLAIYQDQLGRMWFGTEEGVNIYDGRRVVSYKPSVFSSDANLLIGNQTLSIVGDQAGNIFFDSDRALIRYDIYSQKFTCLKTSNVCSVSSNHGAIWVGAADSIYVWDDAKAQLQFQFTLAIPQHRSTTVKEDHRGQYWVGTSHGLYLKRRGTPLTCIIPQHNIYSIFEDSKQNLWVSTRVNGLYKIDKQGNIAHLLHEAKKPNSISDNQVRGVAEDGDGNLWIGTFKGLNKYNPVSGKQEEYVRCLLPGSLTHSSIFPVYKDKQGTLWLGTYYGGVNYFNPETNFFTMYADDSDHRIGLSHPFVGHMIEDRNDRVWICTEGGGLNLFDRKTKQFTYFMSKPDNSSVAQNNLKDIAYDAKRNKLYIATHTGGLSIYDIGRNRFRNLLFENPALGERIGKRINRVRIWKNNLIFTTVNDIFKMDLDTEKVTYLLERGAHIDHVCFVIDTDENLWLANPREGVWRIPLKNPIHKKLFKFGENGLGHFPICDIVLDPKGRLFLGTRGSGLFQYERSKEQFMGYNTNNSLIASDYCYALALSTRGELIITGNRGLTFFDVDRQTFKVVEQGTALPLASINAGCGVLACRDGEILVGGTNGMVAFFEQRLFQPAKNYDLFFSDMYINNEPIQPGDANGVLSKALSYTSEVVLRHHENNLIFSFTSNNYVNILEKITYEYKLEGFDTKWIDCYTHSIQYTNLNPGNYTLVVREKLDHPQQEARIIRMHITIQSPWYATLLAFCIYLLIIAAILYSVYRSKRAKFLLKNSLEFERRSKEAIERLNQSKLQFFSNISHEFRTPLTLILSQVEMLLSHHTLSPMAYNKLLKVHKNSQHLQNLISELLDFRKLEQGHMKLKIYELNITLFLKEIYYSFYEYALANSFTYRFQASEEAINCWFDPKQMQKVFYNLLSNAFKYNKPNATIEMLIEDEPEAVVVKIIDNGIGIKQEDINKIFTRFYQVENEDVNRTEMIGTGIGLSLAKGVVELHRGSIQVESTPEYGSIFIVRLLKGKAHFQPEELAIGYLTEEIVEPFAEEIRPIDQVGDVKQTESNVDQESQLESRTALLIEDNEELLQILVSLFEPSYRVIVARNGKEGLQRATEELPDIIVSDIMMPEMSGTEMCVRIKSNFNLCHIPVVLLTALISSEQNIEGFQRGADDYITKPFHAKLLLARCNNLVRGRMILQKKFGQEREFDVQTVASNPLDQKFLDIIHEIVERHLSDETFDINMMAQELGLSRSSLYTKFKSLVGLTPNDFVLHTKLKRAKTLLVGRSDLQITDIAFMLGFGSPRYFTRCFKAQFEISPAEYRKKQTQGEKG